MVKAEMRKFGLEKEPESLRACQARSGGPTRRPQAASISWRPDFIGSGPRNREIRPISTITCVNLPQPLGRGVEVRQATIGNVTPQ